LHENFREEAAMELNLGATTNLSLGLKRAQFRQRCFMAAKAAVPEKFQYPTTVAWSRHVAAFPQKRKGGEHVWRISIAGFSDEYYSKHTLQSGVVPGWRPTLPRSLDAWIPRGLARRMALS
jgi:hypothetical protein